MIDLLAKCGVISAINETFLVHLLEFMLFVLEQGCGGLGGVHCFYDCRIVVFELSNVEHGLLDILFDFIDNIVQLLIAERERVLENVDSFLAGIDEGCTHFIGIVHFVDDHFCEGRA